MTDSLELAGAARALLDEGLELRARGGGGEVVWNARVHDDDGRTWRARAESAAQLGAAWRPAKASSGEVAALGSLRPVDVDVRVEHPDGRAAGRTVTRLLLNDGVRVRRWRDAGNATLLLPAGAACATAVLDAAVLPAAALLASRGVLVLAIAGGHEAALERLGHVPGASAPADLTGDAAVLAAPPGVPATGDHAARSAAWDALLDRLGAAPR